MKRAFAIGASIVAAAVAVAPAPAQTDQGAAEETANIRRIIVYGTDPCPPGGSNEIIVCARRPDNDRYRIPEELRGQNQPTNESWAARADSIEYMGETGIMSCSPSGPGGHTGCWEQMMRAAREERRRNPQPE